MNRILKRIADYHEIEIINSDAVLSTVEKINFAEIEKGEIYNRVCSNLKKLEKYQNKDEFLDIVNSTYHDVTLLKSNINKLHESLAKLLKV